MAGLVTILMRGVYFIGRHEQRRHQIVKVLRIEWRANSFIVLLKNEVYQPHA